MCGRFTLRSTVESLARHFSCEFPGELAPRYNIAPTQMVTAVRRFAEDVGPRFATLRWGLVPSWAKDVSIGSRMINARSETVADKPAFRAAFRRRRCLIPADGYFEWLKKGRTKQPYYFRMRDDSPLALAGLWESWRAGTDDAVIESCTIITTEANELAKPIHDRMPVILAAKDYGIWLDPNQQDPEVLRPLLHPFASDVLKVDPVSTYVNSPKNDGPKCIQAVRELF